jgi:hypothetical protein
VKAALAVKRTALAKEGKKLGNPRPLEALKLAVAAKRQALSITPEVLKLITDRWSGRELQGRGLVVGRDAGIAIFHARIVK